MSNKDYKEGYKDGFKDGFRQAQEEPRPMPVVPDWTPPFIDEVRCPVCGMNQKGMMGYVCYNPSCPGKFVVTSTYTGEK